MRLRGFIILGAIASILVGFWVGKAVVADSPTPGSEDDPLVTKSYADKAIQERVTELEQMVAELSVQAKALENTLNEVQGKIGTTAKPVTQTPEPPPQKPVEKEPEKEPEKPVTSLVGQTICINTQNYANLRSAPNLEADVLKEVQPEESMYVQKEENGWYNVKFEDETIGWIFNQVVKLKE